MAKKGGVQQLQADINTDEDLEKFCERQGLLVLDVYSEWCGPCLGMVSSLKKIKLELGGDNLHLAICKSDNIDALARFRNKSEPTWLFVTQGKAINIMFGTNVPNLIRLITFELDRLKTNDKNKYDIIELQPIEQERLAIIEAAAIKAKEIEECEAKQNRIDYLDYCTNEIIKNLNGFGVTIFGPQVNRDHMKKIIEIGEQDCISCKDRKTMLFLQEYIEILHYATNNPIDSDVLEQMYNKELLICYWKVSDLDKDRVEDVIANFIEKLTTPHDVRNENSEEAITIPALLTPIEMKVIAEKVDTPPLQPPSLELNEENEEFINDDIILSEEFGNDNKKQLNENNDLKVNVENQEKRKSIANIQTTTYLRSIMIPPIWTPDNLRTTAAAIYVFFRNQTAQFLPPDPIPTPPHLIMAFDAYKRKEITDIMDKFNEDILTYGYFSNQDPQTAQLLANSTKCYLKRQPNITDKFVVKVAKNTNDAILALAALCPSYVSPNTVIGKKEALYFFPDDYNNNDDDELEETGDNQDKEGDEEIDPEGCTEDDENVDGTPRQKNEEVTNSANSANQEMSPSIDANC